MKEIILLNCLLGAVLFISIVLTIKIELDTIKERKKFRKLVSSLDNREI
jgi:hypothetical protein